MAKNPNLTEAMRRALEGRGWGDMRMAALDAGFIELAVGNWSEVNLTPRGQAALAAPRVTAAEYEYMDVTMNEGTPSPNTAMAKRIIAKGWAQYTPGLWVQFTPAGRTALNNIRAASGSPEWKP